MAFLREFWNGLNPSQRVGFSAGVLAILTIAVLSAVWAAQSDYKVLYKDLNEQDAASVVEGLNTLKMDYEFSADGSEILVPDNTVYDARLKLASTGVGIKSGTGFELFDNADYGMTEFAQKINYQRAIQGELSRTITSFAEVSYARVHLVLPKTSLFKKDSRPPKASITLVLEPGTQLAKSQVLGIQRLVSSAVDGLTPDAVSIIDQRGIVISKNESDDVSSMSKQLNQKQSLENYLALKVINILDQVFGPGLGSVNIDATLSYDQIQRKTEEPLKGESSIVLRDKQTKKVTEGKLDDKNKKTSNGNVFETKETDYQVGKSIEQVVESVGKVERLTVSVLIPKSAGEHKQSEIEKLVSAAIGLNVDRGDVIEVSAIIDSTLSLPSEYAAPVLEEDFIPSQEMMAIDESPFDPVANDRSGSMSSSSMIFAGAGVVGFLVLIFMLIIASGKRSKKQLSQGEREELLSDVRRWLNSENVEARK